MQATGFERQLEVTDEVLEEIGANVVPRIRVFNSEQFSKVR